MPGNSWRAQLIQRKLIQRNLGDLRSSRALPDTNPNLLFAVESENPELAQRAHVNEDVGRTVIQRKEAVAFVWIEPFYGGGDKFANLGQRRLTRPFETQRRAHSRLRPGGRGRYVDLDDARRLAALGAIVDCANDRYAAIDSSQPRVAQDRMVKKNIGTPIFRNYETETLLRVEPLNDATNDRKVLPGAPLVFKLVIHRPVRIIRKTRIAYLFRKDNSLTPKLAKPMQEVFWARSNLAMAQPPLIDANIPASSITPGDVRFQLGWLHGIGHTRGPSGDARAGGAPRRNSTAAAIITSEDKGTRWVALSVYTPH